MKKTTIGFIVAMALIIGCAAGVVMHDTVEKEAVAYTGTTWEHKCTKLTWDDFEGNPVKTGFGQEGWEMVSVASVYKGQGIGATTEVFACFKRQSAVGQ